MTAGEVKGSLAPLGSYMHLEMCQSLTLTAEATLGQRSAPPRHWLDITQLKIKMHLVKMEITVSRSMSHMLWNTSVQTGASSCGFVGYGMKLKWFMWTPDVGWRRDWRGGKKKIKQPLPLLLRVRRLVQANVSRLWARQTRVLNPRLPCEGQLARCPSLLNVLRAVCLSGW